MATIRKVERFVRDAHGAKVPRLDAHGQPVLVSRGQHKGTPRYQKEVVRDAHGKPQWRAAVYDPVARAVVTKTFPTETEAKQWVAQLEGRKADHQSVVADKRTVSQYLHWWLEQKAVGAVKGKRGRQRARPRSRTMAGYREVVRYWITGQRRRDGHQVEAEYPSSLRFFGRVTLDKLTHGHLDDFYAAVGKRTTADQVRRLHALLAQAFEEAVRKGYLPHNPCDRASVPQAAAAAEDGVASQALTQGQAQRFLTSARALEREGPYAALWHLLLLTGLRPGEAFALKWDDLVDVPQPAVEVRRALVRTRHVGGWTTEPPKTTNGRRVVPLPALAKHELELWRTRQKFLRRVADDQWQDHGLIFTTSKGTPLGDVRDSFTRVMAAANADDDLGTWGPQPVKKAGRPGPVPARRFTPTFRIYDLRHSCVTLWLRAGVPVHVASKLAGHANAAFTLTVYAKALPEQTVEAAQKLDRMFGTA